MAKKLALDGNTTDDSTVINPNTSKMVIVTRDSIPEIVLQSDSDGKDLFFEFKDDFLVLNDELVAGLSAVNKRRYLDAKDGHSAWVRSVNSFDIKVDLQLTSKPSEKLDVTPRKGMVSRWVRPENIRDRAAKGWTIADDKTKSFLGMTGGAHRVGRLGAEELVLMEKSEATYKASYKAKASDNARKAGFKGSIVNGEAAQAGMMEYDESKDSKRAKRAWNDVVTVETTGEE